MVTETKRLRAMESRVEVRREWLVYADRGADTFSFASRLDRT